MKTRGPYIKILSGVQHKGLHRIFLPGFLACILMLAIWLSNSDVEARYQLQEQIGFVVTIPASTN